MKPVAGYVRVSGAEGQSVEAQEAALREYCRPRGWELQVFADEQSGADAARPGLERIMAAVRRGEVRAVLCVKLDRLGRSLVHLVLRIEELGRLGVPLICPSQGIDTSTDNPVGRLQLTVLMAIAEFERSVIRDRTIDGLIAARARRSRLGRPRKVMAEHGGRIGALRKPGESKACRVCRIIECRQAWMPTAPRSGARKPSFTSPVGQMRGSP